MPSIAAPFASLALSVFCFGFAVSAGAVDLLGPDDFEADFGNYSDATGDDFDWTRDSGGTPSSGTGPSVDHTTGSASGFYLYTEASNPNNPNKTALLESSCITGFTGYGDAEVSFYYHMLGTSQMGTLYVDVATNCTTPSWTNEFSVSGNQGSAWNPANVDLTSYIGGEVKLRFRGVTGSGWSSDIAIDDVLVTATPALPCTENWECDDSDPCTDDVCGVGDVCEYSFNTDPCNDGVACTGSDVCSAGVCGGTDSCTGGAVCNLGSGACEMPAAQALVDALDINQYKSNILALSNDIFEPPISDPAINHSRRWNAPGNEVALDWIQGELEDYGYSVERHSYTYSSQTKESIYVTKVGTTNPDEMYIVCAHMDSYNQDTDPLIFAPGAGDDGSGTALVMEAARVFANPSVSTQRSIRFILWNNEETGLNGAEAYVSDRRPLQGVENPPGSGLYPEPTWLGVIANDMMLWDHGCCPGGPTQIAGADVDIEYQASSSQATASLALANAILGASVTYATDYPAEIGDDMGATDSVAFEDDVASVSLRENRRYEEIGNGANPNWHRDSDVYSTYSELDFLLAFNAVQMNVGALAELAGATMATAGVCGDGTPDAGEDCDDGNTDPGDCCSATCQYESAATVCRASSGVCDAADYCDGAGACDADAKLTSECRASADVCDVAEACDGVADDCPADAYAPATTECRAAAGVCDAPDYCDGAGACEADAKLTSECRASAGACDVAEVCDGVADNCPADAFVPATTECRASAGVCDVAEMCTGSGSGCPGDAFEPVTTECRAAAGVCDAADYCDGASAACTADAKLTSECRASAGVCDAAEVCDGVADDCPADAYEPVTTECRAAAGVCDAPDYCDGAGSCTADAKLTSECRASAGVCDVAEVCDGVADDCPADAFDPECQLGPDDFEIDSGNWYNVGGDDFDWTRDSGGTPSNGTGPSVDHTLGTSAGYYLYTEASNPNNPNMTALLESSCITGFSGYGDAELSFYYHMLGDAQMGALYVDVATNCTTPSWTNEFNISANQGDVWNQANVDLTSYLGGEVKLRFRGVTGSGWSSDIAIDDVLVTAAVTAGVCGDDTVDAGEDCDDGNTDSGDCCSPTCQYESVATECRAAAGVCDAPDYCDGAGACDADAKLTSECRASAGVCDVAEVCDGVADNCPGDAYEPATTECRASAGVCDVAEMCTGSGASCPGDAFEPVTTECRASAGACDAVDYCDGASAACTADAKLTSECRASAGVCDAAEVCDGVADDCPADAYEPATTQCRASAGVCDVAEMCTGSGVSCPADAVEPVTTECRSAAGVCDAPDYCDGVSIACTADAKLTSECRAVADVCDLAEVCDGVSDDCPADVVDPECRLDILVVDADLDALIRVNATSGDRTVVSGCVDVGCSSERGTGPSFLFLRGVITESDGQILVCEGDLTDSNNRPSILRVDPTTGDRTIISGCVDVANPTCSSEVGTGPSFDTLFDIILDANGDIIVADPEIDTLFRVDAANGDRSVLSSNTVGTGPAMSFSGDMALEADGNILMTEGSNDQVLRVDPLTGDRSEVSGPTVGTGPIWASLGGILVEPDGNIVTCDVEGLIRVDPVTGDRTLVSGATRGTGPNFGANIYACDADSDGNLYVVDSVADAIMGADPVSGDRHIVTSPTVGLGITPANLRDVRAEARQAGCGDGTLDTGEQCDDGNTADGDCCSATCQYESAATVCRASAGICDDPDYCDGASAACPADAKLTSECRASAGACDVAEVCDGVTDNCPADAFEPVTTECRASAGACDAADYCDGASAACGTDVKRTSECRASAGICDVAEVCDGIADTCPADVFEPATTECRAAAGDCDVAESCTGAGAACPADGFEAPGTACGDPGDTVCDDPDSCDAVGDCQANYAPPTTPCRAAAGECDAPENCDGASAACPADAKLTSECRPSVQVCDKAEFCNGVSDECGRDLPNNGLPCPDGDLCNGDEICMGWVCTAGTPSDCEDDDVCTADSCDPLQGCVHDPVAPTGSVCRRPDLPSASPAGRLLLSLLVVGAGATFLARRRRLGV